jgi:hypothetical protein
VSEPGVSRRPLTVRTDPALGGRWTSLATPEREWLWHNPRVPAAARAGVVPGDPFVDAGGGEECLPTIGGPSDHGEVWSRPWTPDDEAATVRAGHLALTRRLTTHDGELRADYTITGPPGTPLLHAVHLLLDVGPAARLEVPGRPDTLVVEWPEPGATRPTTWPDGGGVPLDVLGPDDGTARCAVVATDRLDVVDGPDRLRLRWGTPSAAPVSLVVWRNLGGWPEATPYRSIGVEPMLGAETNLDRATPDRLARLDQAGRQTWWLTVTAARSAQNLPL